MPDKLSLVSTDVNSSTDSSLDGNIQIEVCGGKTPYTFLWSDSTTSPYLNGIGPGNYSVVVSDANNCTLQSQFKIGSTVDPYTLSVHCGSNTYDLSQYPRPCNSCNTCNPCSTCTGTVELNIKTDFGAYGDGIHDDECSFEWANDFIETHYCTSTVQVILYIPYGTYLVVSFPFFRTI